MVKDKYPIVTIIWVVIMIFALGMGAKQCGNEVKQQTKPVVISYELDSTSERWDLQYKQYTLEGCEYIVVNYGDKQWGSHKGNCKNPIHQTK